MKIAVFGLGYVGLSNAVLLAQHHDVVAVDISAERVALVNQRKAPIIMWVYAPHWAPIKYKGEWVQFPEYTKECYEDPSWGINPDAAYDCGKPYGNIWKVGWAGVKDKWPDAYKAIKAFTIDNDEMGQMISKVDVDGQKLDDVVAEWIGANEARWSEWIKK